MKKQSGFTLIELLLVLAIIGIIAAIAVPAILGQRDKAKAKAVQSMVANVAGECARVSDARKEAGLAATPADVITAVLALSNYQYPSVKNPYGGSTTPFTNAAGSASGTIYLEGQDNFADTATSQSYPAVVIHGYYTGGSTQKVVALD